MERAGELAVLLFQLFQSVLGVGRDVDLGRYLLGVEDGHKGGGDGDEQTYQDGETQISFQGASHGDGAGGRGHQAVGGVQTAGKGRGHHREGGVGLLRQSAADGRKDHEAGIAEHGDTGHIAHGAHGDHAVLLADQLQNGVGHGQRGAGLLKDRTDDRAAKDHDTDAGHDAAETALDGIDHLGRREAGIGVQEAPDKAHQQSDQRHDDEGVHLELGDRDDHQHHRCNDQSKEQECLHRFITLLFISRSEDLASVYRG